MDIKTLQETARAMVAPPKGILAADESTPTIEKRFARMNIPCTPETRRAYRETLFTTPDISKFISGVILFDETIRDHGSDGTPFPEILNKQGIIPGIKVDKGTKPLPESPEEKITEGLDGLRERLEEYKTLGARFAKWRAVIAIGTSTSLSASASTSLSASPPGSAIPTKYCIEMNARALARYAALCQEAGMVPIVEPEVLLDGDHSLERCEEAITETLHAVFNALYDEHAALEGMVLKPSMTLSGKDASVQASVREVAEATIRTLYRTVPAAVPGVAFLSGGQDDVLATERLNEICKMGPHPWQVTFSFSRGLQNPALEAWHGKLENTAAAQKVFYRRAKLNSAARMGLYAPEMEKGE